VNWEKMERINLKSYKRPSLKLKKVLKKNIVNTKFVKAKESLLSKDQLRDAWSKNLFKALKK